MTTARGQRRREALLAAVVHDIAEHGLVGFSLRRAATAAGTTHKVLLYHFTSADELLREALAVLRDARITQSNNQASAAPGTSLADRVRSVFATLLDEDAAPRVLDQATGLALYDPTRYAHLGRDATDQYLPDILELLPATCPSNRRQELATLILGTLRGLLADLLTSGDTARVTAGVNVFARMLTTEEERWTEAEIRSALVQRERRG